MKTEEYPANMKRAKIITDLEAKLAASEEQTVRLRRFLEDARELAAIDLEMKALPPKEQRAWRKLTRAAAIRRILAEATEPLSPAQIRDQLAAHGRQGDAPKYISAQLNHMQNRDEVIRKRRGQWWSKRRGQRRSLRLASPE